MIILVSKQVKGAFGVHFVAAELYRSGFIATPTTRSTEGIDILVSNTTGSKAVAIQVKTSSFTENGKPSFPIISYKESKDPKKAKMPLKERTEWIKRKINPSAQKFYILVYVPDEFFEKEMWDQVPDYYVVPSKEVLNGILKIREEYLGVNKASQITRISEKTGSLVKDEGVWYWPPPEKYLRKIELLRRVLQ